MNIQRLLLLALVLVPGCDLCRGSASSYSIDELAFAGDTRVQGASGIFAGNAISVSGDSYGLDKDGRVEAGSVDPTAQLVVAFGGQSLGVDVATIVDPLVGLDIDYRKATQVLPAGTSFTLAVTDAAGAPDPSASATVTVLEDPKLPLVLGLTLTVTGSSPGRVDLEQALEVQSVPYNSDNGDACG